MNKIEEQENISWIIIIIASSRGDCMIHKSAIGVPISEPTHNREYTT